MTDKIARMCGVAALFGDFPLGAIERMTALVRHRGPDGEGHVHFPGVQIGHRRLAILDLSEGGRQPLSDPTGRYWLTYNGEIYNYRELKKELSDYPFQTETDSELLLAAYIRWGVSALTRFNGMFAAVIYDRDKKTFFAFRDRFGVKPLYFMRSKEGVAFASEIKQFTALPSWSPEINEERAKDFLVQGLQNHTSETLFRGVYQLRGGEYLEGHELKVGRWYTLPTGSFSGTFEEAKEQFLKLLSSSIDFRFRSDVPVGCCLSGGLDSSTIVSLAKRPVKTFSALSHVKELSEERYIREMNAENYTVTPEGEELRSLLKEILWMQDEPFLGPSVFAQWKVFELASRHGIKVMLDGQGADEQLGGYSVFYSRRLRDLFVSWRLFAFAKEAVASSPKAVARALLKRERSFDEECYHQVTKSSLPMLLHLEDRSSMAHSVEARNPFLDVRLVEFLLSLPSDFKLQNGFTKWILREAMRGILPEKIRLRQDKLGFAVAEREWLKGPLKTLMEEGASYAAEAGEFRGAALFRTALFGHWLKLFKVS